MMKRGCLVAVALVTLGACSGGGSGDSDGSGDGGLGGDVPGGDRGGDPGSGQGGGRGGGLDGGLGDGSGSDPDGDPMGDGGGGLGGGSGAALAVSLSNGSDSDSIASAWACDLPSTGTTVDLLFLRDGTGALVTDSVYEFDWQARSHDVAMNLGASGDAALVGVLFGSADAFSASSLNAFGSNFGAIDCERVRESSGGGGGGGQSTPIAGDGAVLINGPDTANFSSAWVCRSPNASGPLGLLFAADGSGIAIALDTDTLDADTLESDDAGVFDWQFSAGGALVLDLGDGVITLEGIELQGSDAFSANDLDIDGHRSEDLACTRTALRSRARPGDRGQGSSRRP